ncbi:MAG TPA: PilZ domain-containing protein [Candidatus Limnocylindrales bacterium]|nr:PilZ domain-containing protein [Candidatus Limnocylindrales bacterium]
MLTFMPPSTAKSERRRKSRKRPPSLVYVELSSVNGGMMRDLSEEGFCVRVMMPLSAGDKTPFSFTLNESDRVDGEGKILWVEENGRVAGVQFTQISSEHRTLIRNWLKRSAESPKRREAAPKPPALADTSPEQLRMELLSVPAREEKPKAGVTPKPEKAPEPVIRVKEPPPPPPPNPSVAPALHHVVPIEKPVEPSTEKFLEPVIRVKEPPPPPPPKPSVAPTPHVADLTEKSKEPAVERIPEVTAVPGLPASQPPAPSVASVLHLDVPTERPAEPVTEKVSEVAKAPEFPPTPPPQPSVASVLHLSVPAEKGVAPAVEKAAESDSIPELPRLILPRVDFAAAAPPVAPPPVSTPMEKPASRPKEAPKPVEPPEISASVEEEKVEPPPGLPDISTILIQPSGKHEERVPKGPWQAALPSIVEIPAAPRPSVLTRFTLTSAVTIMCLLVLVVGIYVYHRDVGRGLIWLGEQMGGSEPRNSATPVSIGPPSANAPSGVSSNPVTTEQTNAAVPASSTNNAAPAPATATVSHDSVPSVTPLSGIATPASEAGQEMGQTEYLQAMDILRGSRAGADSGEALRLLWISVEKGNPNAEIALADMYWHGQGVTKNCDQARILLTAAARKGSADGKERLRQFQQEGCE